MALHRSLTSFLLTGADLRNKMRSVDTYVHVYLTGTEEQEEEEEEERAAGQTCDFSLREKWCQTADRFSFI